MNSVNTQSEKMKKNLANANNIVNEPHTHM